MKNITVLLIFLAVTSVYASSTNIPVSVVTFPLSPPEKIKTTLIHEDSDFKFVSIDYGSKGKQIPGFYVFQKSTSNWLRIETISTKDAVWGRSPTAEESRTSGKGYCQVGWNFASQYKGKLYVEIPLKTSGSIVFPDKIQLDEQVYLLYFSSGWSIHKVKTTLRVNKADLLDAFNK